MLMMKMIVVNIIDASKGYPPPSIDNGMPLTEALNLEIAMELFKCSEVSRLFSWLKKVYPII